MGTVWFELPACYNPNLGIFGVFWLKKSPYAGQITAKSFFFNFFNADQNSRRRKKWIEVWAFSIQICCQNLFPTSGSGQTEIHKYAYLGIFSLTTSQRHKLIPKANLKRECPYFYSWRVSDNIWKNQKMNLPLYFQKVIWPA